MKFDQLNTIKALEKLPSCSSSYSAMIGCVMIGLWTLFPWCVMECKLFGVCVVSKGAKKTRFNSKMIQKVQCEPFISR